jgi:hypothetical protein
VQELHVTIWSASQPLCECGCSTTAREECIYLLHSLPALYLRQGRNLQKRAAVDIATLQSADTRCKSHQNTSPRTRRLCNSAPNSCPNSCPDPCPARQIFAQKGDAGLRASKIALHTPLAHFKMQVPDANRRSTHVDSLGGTCICTLTHRTSVFKADKLNFERAPNL